jgi:hypothetical protein
MNQKRFTLVSQVDFPDTLAAWTCFFCDRGKTYMTLHRSVDHCTGQRPERQYVTMN